MAMRILSWGAGLFGLALAWASAAEMHLSADNGSPTTDVEWPTYNQTYDGQRFSALNQINETNVTELRERCRVVVGEPGSFNPGPIIVAGTLFVTTDGAQLAIDPVDCHVIWKTLYLYEEPPVFRGNRGFGYGRGRVFRGTSDGRLLALDAKTGLELWRAAIASPSDGEYVSAAPIVVGDRVFVGIAGGDFGIHGRMMAFDSSRGDLLWTFNTVPQEREKGVETWRGETWKHGGGGS